MLDTELWRVHWQGNFEATRPTPTTYAPIPPFKIPIQFNRSVIAISARSANAQPHWQTAGWIAQEIASGIRAVSIPDAEISNQRVFLNRVSIFVMPLNLATTYGITFRFPRWMYDLALAFWQYDGEIYEGYDIRPILYRIEQKVDDISQFGE